MNPIHAIRLALMCTLCCYFNGCSKDKMDEMVSKAKDSATEFTEKSGDALEKAKASASDAASKLKENTSDAVSTVKEKAANITSSAGNLMSINGTATISLDQPIKFPASYIRVIPLNSSQSVVQLKSYPEDGQATTFPAFFAQGTTSSNALDGQSVACRLFAQTKQDGPVWENVAGQPVVITFAKTADGMTASFSNAMLLNVTNDSQTNSSGSFECVDLD